MSSPAYTFKVCLIGDPGVGKSSTVGRFVNDSFETHQVTVGVEMDSKVMRLDTGEIVQLNLWDVAGTARTSDMPMARRYFQGCHCIILVYSIIEKDTYDSIMETLLFAQQNQDRSGFEPMIVLVGNKCDMGNQREVPTSQVKRFAEEKNFSIFMETSAKQGTNIAQLFEHICKELVGLTKASAKQVDKGKAKPNTVAPGQTIKLDVAQPERKPGSQSCSC